METLYIGPSRSVDRAAELILLGLNGAFDLERVPSYGESDDMVEHYDDFFFCAQSTSDTFRYGPLFVGPRAVVRMTEPLSLSNRDWLFTGFARSEPGADRADSRSRSRATTRSISRPPCSPRAGTVD